MPPSYAPLAAQVFSRLQDADVPVTEPADMAEGVWRAVVDPDAPLHQPAGADAVAWTESAA